MNKENLRTTFNQSLLQLIYEFFGTFLLSVLFINYGKYNILILFTDCFMTFSIKFKNWIEGKFN
jgi:hypothetical protein